MAANLSFQEILRLELIDRYSVANKPVIEINLSYNDSVCS